MVSEKKEERIPLRFAFNCIKNALSLVEATRLRDFLFFFPPRLTRADLTRPDQPFL